MASRYEDREVRFDIVEEIGILTTHSTGWAKELNLVSWNGGAAKYDIRDWDPRHERMSKGVTLEEREMRILVNSLRNRRRNSRSAGASRIAEDSDHFVGSVDEAFETPIRNSYEESTINDYSELASASYSSAEADESQSGDKQYGESRDGGFASSVEEGEKPLLDTEADDEIYGAVSGESQEPSVEEAEENDGVVSF